MPWMKSETWLKHAPPSTNSRYEGTSNAEVRAKAFNVGDLVLRCHPDKTGQHKLSATWDGPFIIDKVLTGGAYRIRDAKDKRLEPNPWNAALLRRFYG